MKEKLFKAFSFHFPFTAKNAITYEAEDEDTLIVKMSDGDVLAFDNWTGSYRHVPRDSNNMSEQECKDEFAFRLRQMMARRKLTQMDLAELTGIPQSQISNYVSGKSLPGFYNLDRIVKVLKCSADSLIYRG